ncbi:hypothetical protein [Ilumatobacter sp.]|uniref:hypothetical protein n=1 Tax=Ilumatobacter sp. TaxID=1967498 RepID=UPI003B52C01E
MSWLVTSIVLSIVATVVLNVVLRLASSRRGGRSSASTAGRRSEPWSARTGSSTRVFFPWKAMLIGSIVLTILVNVVR